MLITADNLGRKFIRQWVFRNLNLRLETGNSYTFVGPNGSGKSTILQIIAGILPSTEGQVTYQHDGKVILADQIFRYLVIAAPYLELVEELTLAELITFHRKFKSFLPGVTDEECMTRAGLLAARHKPVKYFSSGMKQRLKLALAFFSDTPILMLDEPTSNLDAQGTDWYLEHVQEYSRGRLLLICSNQPQEYTFCRNIIPVQGSL